MIQRIQSLYLLVALTALSLLFFFPLAEVKLNSVLSVPVELGGFQDNLMEGIRVGQYWFLGFTILTFVIFAGMIWVLFSYKNRVRQMRLAKVVSLMLVLLLGLLLFGLDQVASSMHPAHDGNEPIVFYQWAVYMPIVSLVFTTLANRAIRKDEALVRASDRLR